MRPLLLLFLPLGVRLPCFSFLASLHRMILKVCCVSLPPVTSPTSVLTKSLHSFVCSVWFQLFDENPGFSRVHVKTRVFPGLLCCVLKCELVCFRYGVRRICKAKDMRGRTVHPVSGAKQLEIETVTRTDSVHRLSTTPDI